MNNGSITLTIKVQTYTTSKVCWWLVAARWSCCDVSLRCFFYTRPLRTSKSACRASEGVLIFQRRSVYFSNIWTGGSKYFGGLNITWQSTAWICSCSLGFLPTWINKLLKVYRSLPSKPPQRTGTWLPNANNISTLEERRHVLKLSVL